MKIATFNCNSVRARLPAILKWLDSESPDALCLQETKTPDNAFPVESFSDAGYRSVFRGEKSYNGVAVLTRTEPDEAVFGLGDGDGGASETRLARVRLGDLHLVNTYVPQGRALDHEQFRFKLDWFARLGRYFERLREAGAQRIVWTGDLNVAPEPKDVHDSKKIWPHVCHGPAVTAAFRETVRAGDFEDIFRKHLPEKGTFTFWDYRVRNALDRNVGWRIDHVLATPPAAAHSTSCHVDIEARRGEKPSDHTFVVAEFDL